MTTNRGWFYALILAALIVMSLIIYGQNRQRVIDVRAAYIQGGLNVIIYYHRRGHEPPYSWLLMSAENGPINDDEDDVHRLELKAAVWESEHYIVKH